MTDPVTADDVRSREWGNFIDGSFRASESNQMYDVENPANGTSIASVPDSTAEDVDLAVESAREAAVRWRRLDAHEWGNYLLEVADAIRDIREELVTIETLENGKPFRESRNDVRATEKIFRYFGGAADKFHGETLPETNGLFNYTLREPYGVVGSIIPWNWPPMHTADFTAPQLATGNTVVMKPSPETPLSTLRIAEVLQDVLPDGVVNVVTGGTEPGAALAEHHGIDKIAFTGHTDTGTIVMESAAKTITPVTLELGGKNPNIVLPDADIERAVNGTYDGIFYNQGQACSSGSRLLLHESIASAFLDAFLPLAEELIIGPGTDEETDLAPLASQKQYDKVTDYIRIGKEEGATVLYEGVIPDDLEDGYYVPPVIFGDVQPDMRIANEEIFGPVLSVLTFETIEEAIEIANDTKYGLTAAIWTENLDVANRMARRIEAGYVYLNNFERGAVGVPFGGYKQSGIGRKRGFQETLHTYTRTKAIKASMASPAEGELDSYFE
ncbi:aldehyde dehydrogenase family protein [Natronorubrum sp. JWXQ-INN-674]|uniref:Aldehyde dehydrogenase family protein n=1 Tax=Natronorubrum halalkaliphilum TaxID=2691917 RepID=A0A6B0VIU3_9EURY|nr:aldehyde dehydrogenase family protein [Natronorubrum halalkaliphilum]MXV60519.1 aldehyde dehydrogenase family protein [Natronorubrum halalkaliphilum]